MNDVTRILDQINDGDPLATELLLPLAYDELRKLAAYRLAQEPTGQTLVSLRFFAGLSLIEAAQVLGVSSSTADKDWAYAKAWLKVELADQDVDLG